MKGGVKAACLTTMMTYVRRRCMDPSVQVVRECRMREVCVCVLLLGVWCVVCGV